MYVINKSNRKGNYILEGDITGIKLHSKVTESNNIVREVTICDDEFKDIYINNKFNKKIESLYKLINNLYVEDSDTSDSDVLGLIDKLKGIVVNKYKKVISDKLYRNMLKKLLIIENEVKKSMYLREVYYENNRSKSI